MKFINKNFGFTLAELMVCLGVVSVIATVLIPTISVYKPNNNKVNFKKAYQVTENIVVDLINDFDLYPSGVGVIGFDNVGKVPANIGVIQAIQESNDTIISKDDATHTVFVGDSIPSNAAAKAKFCLLFAAKLNTMSAITNCGTANNGNPSFENPTLTTPDGIQWFLPVTNFTDTGAASDYLAWKVIKVDVNGDKGPNVEDNETANAVCNSNVDRFRIYLRVDGKMRVKGVCAREYLHEVNLANVKNSGAKNSDLAQTTEADNIQLKNDDTGHTVE